MEVRPIQVIQQEVIIPLTYFPEFGELELVVKEDVVVVRARPELPTLHKNKRRSEILKEMVTFEARLEELRKAYLDEYVAFFQGDLVDHDLDHRQLVQRINARYPDETVLICQVTAHPPAPLHLGSPRFIR